MTMCAIVIEVNDKSLLVIDSNTSQEILVNYPCVCNFNVNDRVGIVYDGTMTRSIPPQINATKIFKMPFNKCFRVI